MDQYHFPFYFRDSYSTLIRYISSYYSKFMIKIIIIRGIDIEKGWFEWEIKEP